MIDSSNKTSAIPEFTQPHDKNALMRCGVNTYELRHVIKTIFERCNGMDISISMGFIEIGSLAVIANIEEPFFLIIGVDNSYGSGIPICISLKTLLDTVNNAENRSAHLRGTWGGGLVIKDGIMDPGTNIPPFVKGEK